MSDFLIKAFSDEYLSKGSLEERLNVLYNFREKAFLENSINELLLINCFLEIINGQAKNAEQYFNSNNIIKADDAVIKLAKGMIGITKAEKEKDYQLYESTVKELEEADLKAGSCSLFIKLILNHAYYLLGEKCSDKRKKYYSKAYEIVDSVIEENKNLTGKDKEKLIRFYNDKGNILLQLADFDEEKQPLIYDKNHNVKVYDDEKYQLEKIKRLNRENCLEEAKMCFEEAKAINDKFAYAYNGLGNYYRENKDWDKAIKNYNKAIELDCKFFYPLNYLGDCYRLKEMYRDAKSNFSKAIEINNKHAFSLYGLGKVYYDLGNRMENGVENFKKAEACFRKAIKCDDGFPYAWVDLGNVMDKLESVYVPRLELEYILKNIGTIRGEECLVKAKGNNNKIKNMNKLKRDLEETIGDYYDKLEDYQNKICEIYKEARARFVNKYIYEKAKCEYWQHTIKYFIDDVNSKIARYRKLKDIGIKIVRGEDGVEILEKTLFYSIATGIEEQIINSEKHFTTTFLSNKLTTQIGNKEELKHTLHILRRWNSYTPIIADNSKGGGYFIECKGNGIVIDPGHNFIHNFKHGGFKFADINSILISHAHDDHTADLESIINLLFRYNKQLKEETIPMIIAKEKGVATKTIEDILVNKNSIEYKELKKTIDKIYLHEKKKIELYISEGVFIKYLGMFKYDKKCEIVTTYGEIKNKELEEMISKMNDYKREHRDEKEEMYRVMIIHNENELKIGNVRLHVISASHRDLLDEGSSLGFVFEFDNTALIYTGDTGWQGIKSIYKNIKDKLNDKKIILLSHIGGFKDKEVRVLDNNENSQCYYENHLGRLGLVEINKILKPQICIISEFGEEFKFNRVQIAKIFNESFKTTESCTKFIPADIGLSINLETALIHAIVAIDSNKHQIRRQQVLVEDVEVGEYKKGNSLFYFDKTKLTENECLQELV